MNIALIKSIGLAVGVAFLQGAAMIGGMAAAGKSVEKLEQLAVRRKQKSIPVAHKKAA